LLVLKDDELIPTISTVKILTATVFVTKLFNFAAASMHVLDLICAVADLSIAFIVPSLLLSASKQWHNKSNAYRPYTDFTLMNKYGKL
jgi:hypothetical protein